MQDLFYIPSIHHYINPAAISSIERVDSPNGEKFVIKMINEDKFYLSAYETKRLKEKGYVGEFSNSI